MRNFKRAFANGVVLTMLISSEAFLFGRVVPAQDQPDKTSDAVYEAGSGVIPPKAVHTPNHSFSESARGKKVHGVVALSMIVTAEGRVRDVKVTKSLDEDLDKQAGSAVCA